MIKHSAFKYCLNTSTIQECKLDVPREAEVASQAGYQGIELWVSEIEDYVKSGGTLRELRRIVEACNLEVPNLIAFFQWAHPDGDQRHEGLEEARKVFAMAQELGCPYVAAPPFGITDREDVSIAHLADCFGTLLEIGRQAGVKPLLEFWGISKALGSLREANDVLALVDDPDGALLADVFHMARDGSDLALLQKLDRDRLCLVHVNDYPGTLDGSRSTDRERLYPGDGIAPYGEIMGALKAIGYRGFLSLELFNKTYQEAGAAQAARTGLAKIEQVVEAGG
jgi:2-keto-myo-inositol isomerase